VAQGAQVTADVALHQPLFLTSSDCGARVLICDSRCTSDPRCSGESHLGSIRQKPADRTEVETSGSLSTSTPSSTGPTSPWGFSIRGREYRAFATLRLTEPARRPRRAQPSAWRRPRALDLSKCGADFAAWPPAPFQGASRRAHGARAMTRPGAANCSGPSVWQRGATASTRPARRCPLAAWMPVPGYRWAAEDTSPRPAHQ